MMIHIRFVSISVARMDGWMDGSWSLLAKLNLLQSGYRITENLASMSPLYNAYLVNANCIQYAVTADIVPPFRISLPVTNEQQDIVCGTVPLKPALPRGRHAVERHVAPSRRPSPTPVTPSSAPWRLSEPLPHPKRGRQCDDASRTSRLPNTSVCRHFISACVAIKWERTDMPAMFQRGGRRRRRSSPTSVSQLSRRLLEASQEETWTVDVDVEAMTPISELFGDEELLERALSALETVECMPLALPTQPKWKWSETMSGFSLFKRSMRATADGSERPEVLCSGRLDASVEEVATILHSTHVNSFELAMKGLFDKAFIFGSVEHKVKHPDKQRKPRVTVKTASFAHTETLTVKNDQWCFFEVFAWKPDSSGCRIVQQSLQPHEAPPGRLSASRVNQLHGLTTQYSIERLPNHHEIRIQFYGAFDSSEIENCGTSSRKAKARLDMLARGLANLPGLVQRRRFGMQTFADQSVIEEKNPYCTCCTKKFFFFTKKTRCYLCGYFVCETCTSSEKMETYNGQLATIIACRRCFDCVNVCNYSRLRPIDRKPIKALPDDHSGHRQGYSNTTKFEGDVVMPTSSCGNSEASFVSASYQDSMENSSCSSYSSYDQRYEADPRTVSLSSSESSSPCASSSSQVLIERLESVITDDDSLARRNAATTILNYLLNSQQIDVGMPSFVSYDANDRSKECATCVEKALDVSSYPSRPSQCEFANTTTRNYPFQVAPSMNSAAAYPVPRNENQRLAAIAHHRLDRIQNVLELDEICVLAAAEMQCPYGIITLIEKETVAIIATNNSDWAAGSRKLRSRTFCQHFVMDERPLFVRHPEADIRFFNAIPVVHMGIRFYVGFPVRAEDGTIVASLCCMAGEGREITRTQYWRMVKFADAASKILQAQHLALSA